MENKSIKAALVTGGARRIGAAIVQALHQSGYRVLLHCRHALAEAHDLANQLNQQRMDSVFVLQRELTEPDMAAEIMQNVSDWAGRLDLLVNNASIFKRSDAQTIDNMLWDSMFDINVKVPYLLSSAAYPLLAKAQGAIINITDIHAERPLPEYTVYCQTKAALVLQTKALAKEFAPNVRVNGVAPGAIAWPEDDNVLTAEQQQKIIKRTPLQKHGSPEYIAQAVVSLAENPFVTGQILNVDGGRSACSV